MYKKFYGFKEKPFQLVPNPRFLYLSKKHQNALTYLEYGLSEGSGFILLTGDIGSGKTTVIRHILNGIDDDAGIEVAVISSTNVDSGELLGLVMHEFGIEPNSDNKAKALDAVFHHLIKQYSRKKRVLLVIDEAQNLSIQALEEIRMISNLQTDDQMLLQIILVGQPELKRRLNSAALTQLAQRIAVFYHLGALDRDEIKEYMAFRLEKAGGSKDIFQEDTFDPIYNASGGIPRIINILCDTALVYGYAEGLKRINMEVVSQVIRDKQGLGLMANELTTGDAAPVRETTGGDSFSLRLQALEEKVTNLQQQLDWRLTEIDRHGTQANERLITELSRLLHNEQDKNEKLLLKYERFKANISLYVHNKNKKNEASAIIKSLAEMKAAPPPVAQPEVPESKERTSSWLHRILKNE